MSPGVSRNTAFTRRDFPMVDKLNQSRHFKCYHYAEAEFERVFLTDFFFNTDYILNNLCSNQKGKVESETVYLISSAKDWG